MNCRDNIFFFIFLLFFIKISVILVVTNTLIMKTITLILVSILTLNISILAKDLHYNEVINYSLSVLNLNADSVSITIESKIMIDTIAYVVKTNNNSYTIYLSENHTKVVLIESLIHEIVHVSQMQTKRMKILKTAVWFEGLLYTNQNSNYDNRPFELEAVKISSKIYKQYKNDLKNAVCLKN